MNTSQSEIEVQIAQLCTRSFEAFGEDMACMLGVQISGNQTQAAAIALCDLKKQFKKLVAVGSVRSEGCINGTAFTLLDQESLFTLAGTLVMQPEKVILQNRKFGTQDTAKEITDAIGEVGNLLIGSFDRIFREECPGHGHFVYAKTFVGSPWSKVSEVFEIPENSEILSVSYEMKLNEFPPFTCSIIFPKPLFNEVPAEVVQEPAVAEPAVPETTAEPVAAEPAPAQAEQKAPEPAAQIPEKPVETPVVSATQRSEPAAQELPPPHTVVVEEKPAESVFESIQKITNSPATLPGHAREAAAGLELRGISVTRIMRTQVSWAGPEDTVEQVDAKMQQCACDYVLVGANGIAQGIVSRSDIKGAMSPYLQPIFSKYRRPLDLATLQIRIKWVMTTPVHTIRSDSSVADAIVQMNNKKVRALAVIDQQGASIGLVSTAEILNSLTSLI